MSTPREHTNRLIHASSPYLLQHAHNPVDWYPWGEEAHARARAENKPIFLSIGYSACHWCHVMEHEVFEKLEIAELMNQHFVNIKVDREERPDLDDLYMMATQMMTGSGGWPMSVWLTPQLEPFYAGTYFPPVDGYGRPGFPRLTLTLAEMWRTREADLREQAQKAVEAIRVHADESAAGGASGELHTAQWLSTALEQHANRFDETHGGFGHAPKFPPHQALGLFVQLLGAPGTVGEETAAVRTMLEKTLEAMARGGIYDHVGGGFARYSTDEHWLVPHFEKMLYDNAQLAPVYAEAAVLLGREDFARTAWQTLDFWLREMTAPNGAFYSTLDADSEGHEGKYYVWTVEDILDAVGGHKPEENPEDSFLCYQHFGMSGKGNWHESPVEGGNVLAIAMPLWEFAKLERITEEEMAAKMDRVILKLRAHRAKRIPPGLDDKILTGWNGLMISALAITGRVLREPRYLEAACKAADFLLDHHRAADGRLWRTSRSGPAHTKAFLEDYAYLLVGLLDLHEAAPDPKWLAAVRQLADIMHSDFADQTHGGFFFTGTQHEKLFARMKNAADNATPSANAMAVRGLFHLARITGESTYENAARRAVAVFAPHIERNPAWFSTMLTALVEHESLAPKPGNETVAASATAADSVLALAPVAPLSARAGETLTITLRATITAGYHVQAHRPREKSAFATVARLRCELPGIAQEWDYPPTAQWPMAGQAVEGYADALALTASIRIPSGAAPGEYKVRFILEAQPCTAASCLLPHFISTASTLTITED